MTTTAAAISSGRLPGDMHQRLPQHIAGGKENPSHRKRHGNRRPGKCRGRVERTQRRCGPRIIALEFLEFGLDVLTKLGIDQRAKLSIGCFDAPKRFGPHAAAEQRLQARA